MYNYDTEKLIFINLMIYWNFSKNVKKQFLIKYTEFWYGIYINVYKTYQNLIKNVYKFFIGQQSDAQFY